MIDNNKKQAVRGRLHFVEHITSLNTQFFDLSLPLKSIPNQTWSWSHPWLYFDALRNYLLLTCFDYLGQSAEFLEFHKWFSPKTTCKQRDETLRKLQKNPSALKIVKELYKTYNKIYGVQNSFNRFILEVLHEQARNELYKSIRIRYIDAQQACEREIAEQESVKLEALYRLRNVYTHSLVNIGTASGGLIQNFGKPIIVDGKPMQGYVPIYHYYKSENIRVEYGVRNWPDVLTNILQNVIAD